MNEYYSLYHTGKDALGKPPSYPKQQTRNESEISTVNFEATETETSKSLSIHQKQLIDKTSNIIETTQKNNFNNEKFRIKAMEEASRTMSACLNQKEKLKMPWILHHIATLCASDEDTPRRHQFRFEDSRKAAKFNTKLIKYTDYGLKSA